MKGIARKMTTFSITAGVLLGGSLALAPAGQAASPCGFYPLTTGNLGGGDDGNYEKGIYNHCTSNGSTVKIRVDYTYASEEFCVTAGETELYANPSLGALRYAVAIGGC